MAEAKEVRGGKKKAKIWKYVCKCNTISYEPKSTN